VIFAKDVLRVKGAEGGAFKFNFAKISHGHKLENKKLSSLRSFDLLAVELGGATPLGLSL
jgi:hypothetical protein